MFLFTECKLYKNQGTFVQSYFNAGYIVVNQFLKSMNKCEQEKNI